MNSAIAAGSISNSPAELIPFSFFAYVIPIVLLVVALRGFDTKYTSEVKEASCLSKATHTTSPLFYTHAVSRHCQMTMPGYCYYLRSLFIHSAHTFKE